jgi:hypothetical protein
MRVMMSLSLSTLATQTLARRGRVCVVHPQPGQAEDDRRGGPVEADDCHLGCAPSEGSESEGERGSESGVLEEGVFSSLFLLFFPLSSWELFPLGIVSVSLASSELVLFVAVYRRLRLRSRPVVAKSELETYKGIKARTNKTTRRSAEIMATKT